MLEQDIAAVEYKTKRPRTKDDIVLGDNQPLVKRPRLGPILNARFGEYHPEIIDKGDAYNNANLNVVNLEPRTKKPRIDGVLHHNGPGVDQPGSSSSFGCT